MATIENVEIFRSGTWNGDAYTTRDLDEMVENFHKAGFTPPLKAGHDMASGSPAVGWVASLRRAGDRLVATLRDVSAEVYEVIKRRGYDAVSCEILWDLTRNGQKFRRVLGAVALLGSEIPAVSNLKPLFDSLRGLADASFSECRVYQFDNEEKPMLTQAEAGAQIDRLTRQLMGVTSLDYAAAQARVLSNPDHAELKHVYAFGQPRQQEQSAGDEVHALTQTRMKEHGESYAVAMRQVLNDPRNHEIKIAFARCA